MFWSHEVTTVFDASEISFMATRQGRQRMEFDSLDTINENSNGSQKADCCSSDPF